MIEPTAVEQPLALPAPPPTGTALLGAVTYEPNGQPFSVASTVSLPVRDVYLDQVDPPDTFDLYFFDGVGWTDTGVLLSGALLAWLLAATAVEFFYAPASRGRKAVYLTLASLGFLILAMVGLLSSSHGQADKETSQQAPSSISINDPLS